MTPRGAALALLLSLAGTSSSAPAAASEASVFGIGTRSRALAGAGATQVLGPEASYVNPAALADEARPTLALGYGFRRATLYWQRAGSAERQLGADAVAVSELGFTLPLPLLQLPLALGFASSSPGGSVARAELPLADQPQFPLLGGSSRALDFDFGLGLRAARWLSLGVGLRALASLSGSTEVTRGKRTTTTRVSDTLEPALAPLAGVGARLSDTTDLALVARAPLRADFDMRLSAVDLGATRLPPLDLAGIASYDPWALGAELGQRVGPVTALAGAEYRRFRDTPPLLPATVHCPAERPDCAALSASSPNFHDTVDVRVAVIWRLQLRRSVQAQARAGYAFLPSPAPEQRGADNLLDNTRHRVALGYGVAFAEPLPPLALDAAFSFDELTPRASHKAEDVPAANAGSPTLTSRGHLLALSLALTVKL